MRHPSDGATAMNERDDDSTKMPVDNASDLETRDGLDVGPVVMLLIGLVVGTGLALEDPLRRLRYVDATEGLPLMLVALALFVLLIAAVGVGWTVGSGWTVLAAAAGGFVGPAFLVKLNYLDYARTHEPSLGGLPYLFGIVASFVLGLVAGAVSAISVGLRRRKGPESVDLLSRVCLVGGSVAGLLLIGWWFVLSAWASAEMQNGLDTTAPVPTGRFLIVLLAGSVGALVGGSLVKLLLAAMLTRSAQRDRGLIGAGVYLGALAGLVLLAVVGLPDAPEPTSITMTSVPTPPVFQTPVSVATLSGIGSMTSNTVTLRPGRYQVTATVAAGGNFTGFTCDLVFLNGHDRVLFKEVINNQETWRKSTSVLLGPGATVSLRVENTDVPWQVQFTPLE